MECPRIDRAGNRWDIAGRCPPGTAPTRSGRVNFISVGVHLDNAQTIRSALQIVARIRCLRREEQCFASYSALNFELIPTPWIECIYGSEIDMYIHHSFSD